MEMQTHTHSTGKKGDYWFLDRSRLGTRLLTLALAISLTVAGAACSATSNQTFADPAEISDTRGTSSLLGDTLTATTTLLSSTKWYFDCAVVEASLSLVPFSAVTDGSSLGLKSTQIFDKVEVYFTDRTKTNMSLSTTSFSYRAPKGKKIEGFMVRLKSDGSKWFFDNGKWFVDCDSERWYSDVDSATAPTTTTTTTTTTAY